MWWHYDELKSGAPYDWEPAVRGENPFDMIDFHLDIGCGKLKKGRLGIDRFPADAVDLLIDLETLTPSEVEAPDHQHLIDETVEIYNERVRNEEQAVGLPFPDNSIESIITHHAFEHVRDGFVPLMDDCHRVLKPGGVLRIVVPLFPSKAAVEDPDHKRYFMVNSFESFCGTASGEHWMDSFSVPYTGCRFELVNKDYTKRLDDPYEWWGEDDAREIRVALRKHYPPERKVDEGSHASNVSEGGSDAGGDEVLAIGGPAEAGGDRELAKVG